jgi:serine/threonine protein kinase
VGDIVAHYRVERLIGRGGMGTVYEVSHVRVSAKRFAMKVLSSEVVGHSEAESRFMREAEAASRLNHPHVVNMVDFGRDRGITYLTMELLEGEDLSALIARKSLPVERVADIMLAVCSGVSAAHQLGIIHRDLKPQNVFLCRNPMGDTVPKVLDFGISKLRLPGDPKLTQRFSLIGTPNYVSPEQAEGGHVDSRCDVYALGTILYECVTRRSCHEGATLYAILRSIAEADYPRPSALRPDLSPEFEAVILRALERNPDARFATVEEMGRALVPFASLKRQAFWKDYYYRSQDGQMESSAFSAFPISLSRHQAPVQPKTELLPEELANPLPRSPFRSKAESPAPPAAPSSSRRPISRPRGEVRGEAKPAAAQSHARRWPLFAAIGGVAGVALLGGWLIHSHRSPVDSAKSVEQPRQVQEVLSTPPSVESAQLAPAADSAMAVAPTPTLPSAQSPPASLAEYRRSVGEAKRPTRVSKTPPERPRRRVERNRSGIPLLKP